MSVQAGPLAALSDDVLARRVVEAPVPDVVVPQHIGELALTKPPRVR